MGYIFCNWKVWWNCISGKAGEEWWPILLTMFFLKISFFFSLLQSCNDSSRKLNLLRTEWFIKTRAEHKGSRHTGITAPGHSHVGDMICPLRICPVCYWQKVLTAIVTNFTAIVLAGTIATQWSDYKIMSQLNNLLNLKLVKMQVLNINSGQREAMQKIAFSHLSGSVSLASFSLSTPRGPCLVWGG